MTNKKPSQARQILGYLKTGHLLTPFEALEKFGCMRLAARVHELRQGGHNIRKIMTQTASGKRVATYFWKPGGES